MNAISVIDAGAVVVPPEHLDKYQMSELIGIPPRAICRWLKGSVPIPHIGAGHQVTFPKEAAIAWMVEHVPHVRPRLSERGLV